MAQESPLAFEAFITYVPLRTEVPFRTVFPLPENAFIYEIPPRASLDPFMEAHKARAAVGARGAAILMPGRRFDAAGTRFGQGGGWYDRFLSETPESWTRIGFCYARQFSETPLKREPWDQAVDVVYVVDEKAGTVSTRETKARI